MSVSSGSRTRSGQLNGSRGSAPADDRKALIPNVAARTVRSTSPTPFISDPPLQQSSSHPNLNPTAVSMTTETMEHSPDTAEEPVLANGVKSTGMDASLDSRSSSLSEIEDGADDDHLESGSVRNGENDSEAETERLDITPQNSRRHKDVLVSSGSHQIVERSPSKLANETKRDDVENRKGNERLNGKMREDNSAKEQKHGEDGGDKTAATKSSEMVSNNGIRVPSPPDLAGRKRKRPRQTRPILGDDIDMEEPIRKRTGSIKSDVNGEDHQELNAEIHGGDGLNGNTSDKVDDNDNNSGGQTSSSDDSVNSANEAEDPTDDQGRAESRLIDHKEKRKAKKEQSPEQEVGEIEDVLRTMEVHNEGNLDIEEDAVDEEAENAVEAYPEEDEAETAARDEEEVKKRKSAMDSLSTIEKHFSTFRDKLFDERIFQLTQELDLLNQSEPAHPEYLAMMHCLDERRDEKIQLEQTKLQYNIKGLQTKSVAEKSQIHSQYFQTVRDLRESIIENIGDQWYQIQKGRRGWEGRVSDYTYNFPTRRSQQITQQTSYNAEVSVLAGVRKYVGFPAAPQVEGVRSSEFLDDFKAMGIKSQPQSRAHNLNHPPKNPSLGQSAFGTTIPASTGTGTFGER
ncbi:MAG: hypothetical protein M1837_003907 [Sclerophora amabilis]|nr:MAG: hypothetical protein M1837_003907 [Sclerophora amabilis]